MHDDDYKPSTSLSNLDKYKSFGIEPKMPPIEGAEYLLHHLDNLGWVGNGAMGAIPLTFQEIKAYIDSTNASLSPDEVLLIRRMSQLYVGYSNDKNPESKAPYSLPK